MSVMARDVTPRSTRHRFRFEGIANMFRMKSAVAALVFALAALPTAAATLFTYQGKLDDGGSPANGTYDFAFTVVNGNDSPLTATLPRDDIVVTDGVFTVPLDFGNAFSTTQRYLRISVRPGAETGPYTTLTPNTPFGATPTAIYSDRADRAQSAFVADDVVDGSINTIDLDDQAVTTAKIANNAVTATQIASNALTLAKFEGQNSLYGFTISAPANDCTDYSIAFNGDVDTDDIPILSLPGDQVLPDKIMVTALRVSAPNTVVVRICNVGTTSVNTGALTWRLTTLR
jgi:hypothetical protein